MASNKPHRFYERENLIHRFVGIVTILAEAGLNDSHERDHYRPGWRDFTYWFSCFCVLCEKPDAKSRKVELVSLQTALVQILGILVAAVVLLELSIDGLAPDTERAGGVSFISPGVVEGGFNRLAFNFIH